VTLALLAASLAAAPPAHAATHQVRVEDNVFLPKTLDIDLGDTVAWTAMRGQHTVTADDGRFDFHPDRALNVGEQVSWTFQENEVVRYFCRLHGGPDGQGMAGVIRVGDPPEPPVADAPVLVVPDDVATLADAAAGAQPGTQVLVRPGVYPEEVVVTVPGLEIRGLGERPDEVVLDGGHARDVGVAVAAPGVRIENLSVTGYRRAGIVIDGVAGTVVADTTLHDNGLYGVDARASSGVTLRRVRASGHGVAGIGVRDCVACGVRIDGALLDGNAAGVVAVAATGIVVRDSHLRGNAVGIVLRDVAGSQVTGNTLTDNAATDVWVASLFDEPQPPIGAGVWISGGRGNLIASNLATGHTYNIVVTGPSPALEHRIAHNTLSDAEYADLGWDGPGTGVCFSGNRRPPGGDPSSHPPRAQTLYDCAMPTTAGLPYPIVTANLAAHAREVGYPIPAAASTPARSW
jgi:plastocyanin